MSLRAVPRSKPFTAAMQDIAALREPACLLDPDGVILYVNDAWERSAAERGGGHRCASSGVVGRRWLEAISGEEPRRLHAVLLHRALRRLGGGPGGAVIHTSEDNDGTTARLVATHLEPVVATGAALVGLSVVHRTLRELPLEDVYAPVAGGETGYRDAAGELRQCSCCRRTRRAGAPDEWDYVPALVLVPPSRTVFGYCPLCLELHCSGGPGVGGPIPLP
jgi:hypothetical protein